MIVGAAELMTPVTNSVVVSRRVAHAPDRLQGRVQAASTVVSFSAGWAGPLLAGIMVQDAGPTATVLTLTGWALALAAITSLAPAFRRPPSLTVERART